MQRPLLLMPPVNQIKALEPQLAMLKTGFMQACFWVSTESVSITFSSMLRFWLIPVRCNRWHV